MAQEPSMLIPVNGVLDSSLVVEMKVDSPEFKAYIKNLTENVNSLILAINSKDIAIYTEAETVTGQVFFDNDQDEPKYGYRRRIICGALPSSATKQIAHGLDNLWSYKYTRIYGVSTDTTAKVALPLPYASASAADAVEVWLDSTNVNIKTNKNRTSFDTTSVVIEYLE